MVYHPQPAHYYHPTTALPNFVIVAKASYQTRERSLHTAVFAFGQKQHVHVFKSVVPVAYQVIVEPGIGQFRHVRIGSWRPSCPHIYMQQARGRESATLDDKSTGTGIPEPHV